MNVKPELLDMREMYKKMFEELYTLPAISDRLEVSYMDRYSGSQISSIEIEYNESEMSKNITYALKFWNGERESAPVPESETRKCGICKFFGKECRVWWKGA